MHCRDDHRFSLLHWASRGGWASIVDMLIARGARINATNMGDDTALHLAASHGHTDIVLMVRCQVSKLLDYAICVVARGTYDVWPQHYSEVCSYDPCRCRVLSDSARITVKR